MSDSAANCVLGDKDRSRNSLLVIGFSSETPTGLKFLLWGGEEKKKLVRRK